MDKTHVSVELTTICNASCIFCFTHSPLLTNPYKHSIKYIDENIFSKAISDPSIKFVHLFANGEPFLHPAFYDFAKEAKAQGKIVEVHTNFTKVDISRVSDIDSLIVNLPAGSKKDYEKLRSKTNFAEVEKNLLELQGLEKRPRLCISLLLNSISMDRGIIRRFLDTVSRIKPDVVKIWPMESRPGLEHLVPQLNQEEFHEFVIDTMEMAKLLNVNLVFENFSFSVGEKIKATLPIECPRTFIVNIDGSVSFCPINRNVKLQNFYKGDLDKEIKDLISSGNLNICDYCPLK